MIDGEKNFDFIYERNFSLLMRVLVRMTGNTAAAEDICQEAFIKFYQHNDGFPSFEDAKFWLLRVARNLALNYEQRKKREVKAYKKFFLEPSRRSLEESGEDAYIKKEDSRKVEEALNIMPAKLREVLVLKEYGDLPYRDIAAALKISEGNVKVRVFRAREWLAAFFGKSEETHVS